jgi:hypothetical protein
MGILVFVRVYLVLSELKLIDISMVINSFVCENIKLISFYHYHHHRQLENELIFHIQSDFF